MIHLSCPYCDSLVPIESPWDIPVGMGPVCCECDHLTVMHGSWSNFYLVRNVEHDHKGKSEFAIGRRLRFV